MRNFHYHAPTAIYSGENCIEKYSRVIRSFGQRAFIITSRFYGNCHNLALEDAERLFGQWGTDYCVYEDVEENPSVESIVRVTEQIRAFAPDYIFAIGGGSALDTAKAANVLLKHPAGSDAYRVFYSGSPCPNSCNAGVLPLLSIPTTAGSGSEVMGFAVLTRADTNTKLRMNQLSYFEAAFLDPRYILNSPQWLLDTGAMDALAHGVEGYYNTGSSTAERIWHDYGFRLLATYKDNLLAEKLNMDDCGHMLVAASVQGMGIMQSGTTVPHGMGYPLTHFKNVSHGIASAMTLPAFMEMIRDPALVEKIVLECGFSDIGEFNGFIREITRRNVSITVTEEEIHAWTEECMQLKGRLALHPDPIDAETVKDIYRKTLADYIVPEYEDADSQQRSAS